MGINTQYGLFRVFITIDGTTVAEQTFTNTAEAQDAIDDAYGAYAAAHIDAIFNMEKLADES